MSEAMQLCMRIRHVHVLGCTCTLSCDVKMYLGRRLRDNDAVARVARAVDPDTEIEELRWVRKLGTRASHWLVDRRLLHMLEAFLTARLREVGQFEAPEEDHKSA